MKASPPPAAVSWAYLIIRINKKVSILLRPGFFFGSDRAGRSGVFGLDAGGILRTDSPGGGTVRGREGGGGVARSGGRSGKGSSRVGWRGSEG